MDELNNGEYAALLGDIKTRIHSAQYAALRAVNTGLRLPSTGASAS